MRYVAAYLLAVLGGNSSPSKSDLKSILESVGVGFDEEKASLVCKNLQGKDVNEVIICHLFLLGNYFGSVLGNFSQLNFHCRLKFVKKRAQQSIS